jgi:hypothetical protein
LVLINVSPNTAAAMFKVSMWCGKFHSPYIGPAVSGKIDLMVLIHAAEEQAVIQ